MNGFVVQCPQCRNNVEVEVKYLEGDDRPALSRTFEEMTDIKTDHYSGSAKCKQCDKDITVMMTVFAGEE